MLDVTADVLDHYVPMETREKPEHDREWLVEQRYRAVREVLDGSPAREVAVRYGVSRQSVYAWKAPHAAGASAVGCPQDRRRGGAAGRGGRAIAGGGAPGAGPRCHGDAASAAA